MVVWKQGFVSVVALCVATAAVAAEYKAGEVIVKYREGVSRSRLMMNDLYTASGVQRVKRYTGIMKGYEQLVLHTDVNVEDAIAELQKNPAVEYVQPNYILRLHPVIQEQQQEQDQEQDQAQEEAPPFAFGRVPCVVPGVPYPPGCVDSPTPSPTPAPGNRPALKPAPADVVPPVTDPSLSKAYGLTKTASTEAWKTYKGTKDFIVAVIDTGIDYNHEDLAFNVWRNPKPTQNDIVGFDYIHNDGLPYDDNQHGTHTAGTVGAVGGNGKGVSGVAQRVSIMGLKFLSGQGSGTSADAIRAIDYAIAHGAKVLSNSWGGKGDEDNKALYDAIERAKAKDVLFIAAAGNDGTDNDGKDPSYPAAFDNDNLIAVASTDEKDKMSFFSNYGKKTTHVGAPGSNVYSTVPGNKYSSLSGTSMACPHVAGAAALVWAAHPTWKYKDVKAALMSTVDKLPALAGKTVSGGRINVAAALKARKPRR